MFGSDGGIASSIRSISARRAVRTLRMIKSLSAMMSACSYSNVSALSPAMAFAMRSTSLDAE